MSDINILMPTPEAIAGAFFAAGFIVGGAVVGIASYLIRRSRRRGAG